MQEAKRGFIYTFDDKRGAVAGTRYVVVVSSADRDTDNIINILFLGDADKGIDVVSIKNENFENDRVHYVHCDCVTYTRREYLKQEVGYIGDQKLQQIERKMSASLGLNNGMLEQVAYAEAKIKVYKDMLKAANVLVMENE